MIPGMEPVETFSVKQTSKLVGKAPNTLRTWSSPEYFGPFLSAHANPEPGGERRFTEEDIRVLRTAVILQKRGLQIADIIPRLGAGEILEEIPGESIIEPPEERGETPGRELVPPSLTQQMELFMRPFENQISRLSAELELARLKTQLEERGKPWFKRLFGG